MIETYHRIMHRDSRNLSFIESGSVDLVVTSPPYPMIKMWDEMFTKLNPVIKHALSEEDGYKAFELMHLELDKAWSELYRVLRSGGIMCINIGDATRSLGRRFRLYPNGARILSKLIPLKFDVLPKILWRKSTNSPTKFMGSGMLPAGAYVTLEHEYILILRKGEKRPFLSDTEKKIRHESSYFWEERNKWFSDMWEWDVGSAYQKMTQESLRDRSGAFPFELPYRLINMYSVKGDCVLDPFLGTGTTSLAALSSCRSSIGIEIDEGFSKMIAELLCSCLEQANSFISERLAQHTRFIEQYELKKGKPKYINETYGFPVITNQERKLGFNSIQSIEVNNSKDADTIHAVYYDDPSVICSPQYTQKDLF